MGVKISEILLKSPLEVSQLSGKIIAIDAPNIIFSLFSFAFKSSSFTGNLIIDRTQQAISHLYGLLYRINFYYSKKILPIFCFDGRISNLKRRITKDQLSDFLWTKDRYNEAILSGNKGIAKDIALGKEYFWHNTISESKELLGALGVPYVDSPASAESQCAELVKRGIVEFSNSQDFDSLLFGCPEVIQNLSKSQKKKIYGKWIYKKIEPVRISLSENLKLLNINYFQLIDLALLIGTDYNTGISGIGPKTALKLIKKYGDLERIVLNSNEKEKYSFNNLTVDLIHKIRKIFIFPKVLKNPTNLHWNFPNKNQILNLLCFKHNLNKSRVGNNTDKLIKEYSKCLNFFKHSKNKPKLSQKSIIDFSS